MWHKATDSYSYNERAVWRHRAAKRKDNLCEDKGMNNTLELQAHFLLHIVCESLALQTRKEPHIRVSLSTPVLGVIRPLKVIIVGGGSCRISCDD